MREDSSAQELKVKEVDTRIEREIADLRTSIQASKVRICKYFASLNGILTETNAPQATTLQYLVGISKLYFEFKHLGRILMG